MPNSFDILKEIESYDNQINTMYQQLRAKEEQLVIEERKSDQILLTVSKVLYFARASLIGLRMHLNWCYSEPSIVR